MKKLIIGSVGPSPTEATPCYRWLVLQDGELPLRPDLSINHLLEHRCTSVILWPADQDPSPHNVLVTDPCFTRVGLAVARRRLQSLGLAIEDLGRCFVTHGHLDHTPHLPPSILSRGPRSWTRFAPGSPSATLVGFEAVACPGHEVDLHSLVFWSRDEQGRLRKCWVVGDAVLDEDWLRAWGYYWPNQYSPVDIVQTWRSVARVLEADWIFPGHGPPIQVTQELLVHLERTFPLAEFADDCPDVARTLARLIHPS